MKIVRLSVTAVKSMINNHPRLSVAIMPALSALLCVLSYGSRLNLFRGLEKSAMAGTSTSPKQRGCCANQPAVLRRMTATYYTIESNFKSTLILNNKGPHQIVVTPILHAQNGQTYTAPTVAVGGQSSGKVDLNAIAAGAGPQFKSGSLEFTYTGGLLEMGCTRSLLEAERQHGNDFTAATFARPG